MHEQMHVSKNLERAHGDGMKMRRRTSPTDVQTVRAENAEYSQAVSEPCSQVLQIAREHEIGTCSEALLARGFERHSPDTKESWRGHSQWMGLQLQYHQAIDYQYSALHWKIDKGR